ncbi:hypothetical protein [Levilactobacillus acidifarinae]|uniref:Surface layer protein A domain-containing protein n=1 Tax=Levilactobacillus acidifarinae DSM 19394 = JCM 15949 TaxID=1423715 RepID=A0A0R1LGY7_9LACO|nr:hypothetical protein [Levilactobacillus acidifarinae]KRK95005.1 hypothetical protein FD25_GL002190 [Levilactobacillus acidifarinae DSM 19394]GEO70772.1 hypothetical protein LAC03_26820 [Levilactobacillus acidifarinae]
MKLHTSLIFGLALISAGLVFSSTTVANAASSKTKLYRSRVAKLNWKHPYDNDTITEMQIGSKTFKGPDDNGKYLVGHTAGKYKDKSIKVNPKKIRGHWYNGETLWQTITKTTWKTSKANNKYLKVPKQIDFSKVSMGSQDNPDVIYTWNHGHNKYATEYGATVYHTYAGMYGWFGKYDNVVPFKVKTATGKIIPALFTGVESKGAILYQKPYKNLPTKLSIIRYFDDFGEWTDLTELNISCGKTVSVSAINKTNQLSHPKKGDGGVTYITLPGGGSQALQYMTKVKGIKVPADFAQAYKDM